MLSENEDLYAILFTKECTATGGPILPDPEEVGETEYSAAYEMVRVVALASSMIENPVGRVVESLDNLAKEALELRRRITSALRDEIPEEQRESPQLVAAEDFDLAYFYTPTAIREHFEIDVEEEIVSGVNGELIKDLLDEVSDEQLREATWAELETPSFYENVGDRMTSILESAVVVARTQKKELSGV